LQHAVKNAFIPVITVIGLQVSVAVSGSVIMESIFNIPGIGKYLVGAVFQRDYPSIQLLGALCRPPPVAADGHPGQQPWRGGHNRRCSRRLRRR
jgi:Binding-protein-dependent transport system inner membrane component